MGRWQGWQSQRQVRYTEPELEAKKMERWTDKCMGTRCILPLAVSCACNSYFELHVVTVHLKNTIHILFAKPFNSIFLTITLKMQQYETAILPQCETDFLGTMTLRPYRRDGHQAPKLNGLIRAPPLSSADDLKHSSRKFS